MDMALDAAQWVVGKALAPVTDGVLQSWEASKNFGLNIEDLKTELQIVQATLETHSQKQIPGPAVKTLLQKLQDLAHNAEDLLDELDYFRIHDELHGTFDAADEHAKGGMHNLILYARHTAKAVGKLLALSTSSSSPRPRQRARANSSSTPNASQVDEEVSGCMRKLGKLLPCSSFTHVHDDGDDSGKSTLCGVCMHKAPQRNQHAEQTPKLEFNRVDISERMKHIVKQLQPLRREVCIILQSCVHNDVIDIAQSRPITSDQSIDSKLYGRDRMVNSIINNITKGKYRGNDLTVLPIVGPGGIGKTTMIQHIYNNKEVKNHFQAMIWVCVSVNFNLNKILEEMKTYIPRAEGEKEGRAEELIEQRLKSKRFLLVLDDIWKISNEDDWERLLLPLKRSGEKGSMILVTTRIQAIARMVKTTNDSIELQGLESQEFRKLFLAFIFGNEQCRNDCIPLLDTGYKIMEKLKRNPLAAKTVGRLLKNDLSLPHWRKVLESKEWERQTGNNDIMPALKLSYDYLPFQQQQCFSYSALFPEGYRFSSSQLINLWIGLDLFQPGDQSQTFDDIGLSNLNDLVTGGFFREDKNYDGPCYVMHDLLHDLALRVASHECLSLHCSNVRSVKIRSCIRHLCIIIDEVGDDNAVFDEEFKSELRNLKNRLKVEHLQTLMLFGKMDESFANTLGDLFREANALRVLHLPSMTCTMESMLHKFSALVHLRYLSLEPIYSDMHLPHIISRFYHLRILDLKSYDRRYLPKDMSNLVNLCHFNAKANDQHSEISNVGKLKHLQELKVFRVNKKSEGFELKQLEHLTELRELGIYNLEKIQTKEEAAKAKLIEKYQLERLTLDWDSERSNSESVMEAVVLESLQPHRNIQVLHIRGHRGPSCPTWLCDKLAVEALQSLHLVGVSWECIPSLGKMWEIGELRTLVIYNCPKLVLVDPPTLLPDGDGHSKKTGGGGGGLQALRSLESLEMLGSPKFLSACLLSSPSRCVFPSSLKYLSLRNLEGMRTLEPLSNLTSLTHLTILECGEDLRCEGLQPLLTTGGQLSSLEVHDSPRFFAGWDPRRVLHDGGGEQQQLQPQPPSSSTLRKLKTNDTTGLLAAHICTFLSSSLTSLRLEGVQEMELFTKEQEDALHLLASLQKLIFVDFKNLQHLPAGLHKLTSLKELDVLSCPAVSSLPEDGLPNSLQRLYVSYCDNEELKQKCRDTHPDIYK